MGSNGRESAAIKAIQQRYGRVMNGPDVVKGIPTGSVGLDRNTGVGGWPRGRISEVWGENYSGKTLLMTHSMIECARAGGESALIDLEGTYDWDWAVKVGLDTEKSHIIKVESAEAAFASARILLQEGAVDLLIFDSAAALVPQDVLTGAADQDEAMLSRMLSRELAPLKSLIDKSNAAVVFLNQERCKVKKVQPEGAREAVWETAPTGGNALGFYATLRCSIEIGRTYGDPEQPDGSDNIIRVVQNKLARGGLASKFRKREGVGIVPEWELAMLAKSLGVVRVEGESVTLGSKRVADSMRDLQDRMINDQKLRDRIYKAVIAVPPPIGGDGG